MNQNIVLFEKAKEIALSKNNSYNRCQEYNDAFYFFKGDQELDGGDTGIVIEKNGGKVLKPYTYFLSGRRGIKEIGKQIEI